MSKNTNTRKSALPPEKSSALTVNEFLKLFIVIMLAVVAIHMDNIILLLILLFADLIFVAFVLAGPTPSTFKEFRKALINLLKLRQKL